ncbi:MAG: hypothetical protein IPM32_14475 [Ignavibacteriae bacterium]|nr:hypothetical protein [Ignavibacteriota bacterium]
MNEKRKMAFFEIGDGTLAADMQKAFERVQFSALNHGVETQVTLEINIFPSKDERFGSISYKIKEKHPGIKSIKLTTQLDKNGFIISDSDTVIGVLQHELNFKESKEPTLNNLD